MAKKSAANTEQTNNQQVPSPFSFGLGLALILIGIMLFVTIISFLFTGAADRSISDMPLYELMTNTEIEVSNPLGRFGAWVADMLVTNGIGIMALVIPWLIVIAGLRVLSVRIASFRSQLIFCLCFAIWGSLALGFVFSRFSDSFYAFAGGAHGYFMSKWLTCIIGSVGTSLVLLFILFVYLSAKIDAIRIKVVSLLKKIHINIPHIELSSYEGNPINVNDAQTDKSATTQNMTNGGDNGDEVANQDGMESKMDEPNDEKEALEISRPQEEMEQELVPSSETKPEENLSAPQNDGIEILNAQEEETVDEIHRGIDTKYDPTADLSGYKLPPIDLLKDDYDIVKQTDEELLENKNMIVQALENFQIKIEKIMATVGPTVTLYEIVPAPGIRISKIQNLEKDIALSLKALGIRIIAPMPGRGTIGFEVPNSQPQVVSMNSVIRSKKFQESTYELPVALGKTISNETLVFDLAKTPHLLVAGATGQGKSVGLNAIITSILYKKHPSQVKFVMIDPKMVEFSIYKVLENYFLAKMPGEDNAVITDVDKVKNTLLSLTIEMDNRYKLLEKANVRQIREYNERFVNRRLNPENGHRYLPYIIVVIDEFADLIMQAGKEVETPIARIAQKARAVGIHMILATQRPSTNIITGVIKAQFPSRIAFKVASMTDSRTILDMSGAQHLIGRGDMLFSMTGTMTPTRVQCAFVDTPEVEAITKFISSQQGYVSAYELPDYIPDSGLGAGEGGDPCEPGKLDSKIRDVAYMVVNSQIGSTSNIQRQFEVGYNRAGKLMDQLERMGIVSPPDGSKPRNVLITTEKDLEEVLQRFGV